MNYFHKIPLVILCFALFSCETNQVSENETMPDAQQLVNKAIELHGGDLFEHTDIRFTFRDKSYRSLRDGEIFQYERSFEEEGDRIEDVMTADSFTRKVNGEIIAVPDTMVNKYRNSINSVHYFAFLPYKLNDPAVQKKYLGTTSIEGTSYHKVEVTFRQEGGGEDHQDVFVYFFNVDTGFMDHLAYSYETEGGGLRFRKGYNYRTVSGIRFADYINFKADPALNIHDIAEAFTQQKLDTLSLIELEDIEVRVVER